MRIKSLLVVSGVCVLSAAGFAAPPELGLTAVDHGAPASALTQQTTTTQEDATTQPDAGAQADATTAKSPPQLGLGPTAIPAAPAVVTQVIVEQRVIRVPARRAR